VRDRGDIFQERLFLEDEQLSPLAVAKPEDLTVDDGGAAVQVGGAV
jgi:hypothetical protein